MLKQIKTMPAGAKASVAFFIASIVSKGISYITTPIYTRLLTPDDFGQVSLFMTWMSIFGVLAMFCLSYGVFNNGMQEFRNDRDSYSFSMLILSNVITVCVGMALLISYPLIQSYLDLDLPLILLMIAVFFFQPAYNFWTCRQRYEYKYKMTLLATIGSAILSPTVAIICIFLFPYSKVYSRIFGAELALIATYLVFYVYIVIKGRGKLNVGYWKYAIIFNLPLIPHYLSTYLLNSSDRLMISYLVSDSATAYYSVAYSVASVVSIVWTAANTSLIPYTYEKCEKKEFKPLSSVTNSILLLFACACAVMIFMAPEIVAVMGTEDYQQAIYVIPPVVGGVFFQAQYYIYANVLYYYKKPKFVMIGSLISTALNIILNYVFIKLFGFIAAGYTTLVCFLIQASIDYFAMKHVVKQEIYDMRFIGVLSLAVVVVSGISCLLYQHSLVRYCILLVGLVLVVIYRKHIISLVKSILKKESNG